jgi:hypothetical protein
MNCSGNNFGVFLERGNLALSALVTVATLSWLLWSSRYGLDLTDESSYLVFIADPWIYKATASQYAYIYHPLYLLVNGDIAALRQANILIIFTLAGLLCYTLLRGAFNKTLDDGPPPLIILVLSTAFAISAFLFLNVWLPSPSYNSLAMQSLLIAAIGLLLAKKDPSRSSLLGWGLIGLGGWLAFMAKPTTAAGLGVVSGLYLFAAGKLNFRLLVLSLTTAVGLLLCSALAIDGSILGFVERLKNGAESYAKFRPVYTASGIFRWDFWKLGVEERLVFACSAFLVSVTVYLSFSNRGTERFLSIFVSNVAAFISLALIFGILTPPLQPHEFQGLQFLAVPLGILLAVLVKYRKNIPNVLTRDGILIALCFASLPHVYAFGTDNNYWSAASLAGLFWGLAGVAILAYVNTKSFSLRTFLPITTAAQLTTIVLIYINVEHPYRQPLPLRQNDQVVVIGADQAKIALAGDFAEYLVSLRQIASRAGFEQQTPVIDMTGHYPGALYSLGAESIGRSWINGGHEGSEVSAIFLLDLVPCGEIARAWILAEENGPRQLSMEILRRYGVDVQHDYTEAGTLMSPKVYQWGFDSGPLASFRQRLLKPKRSSEIAVSACELRRQRGP